MSRCGLLVALRGSDIVALVGIVETDPPPVTLRSQVNNSGVVVPGLAGSTFLSDIDWAFYTKPQAKANNCSVYWPRGKMWVSHRDGRLERG